MNIPEAGLQLLERDLLRLEDQLRDDKFAGDLYRGLAGNRLSKDGEIVAVSWKRAEELVSGLRGRVDRPPVELFQTGGETWVADSVRAALDRLGWHLEPLDVEDRDPVHADVFASPPPSDQAEQAR
jgi:hypothetical protein